MPHARPTTVGVLSIAAALLIAGCGSTPRSGALPAPATASGPASSGVVTSVPATTPSSAGPAATTSAGRATTTTPGTDVEPVAAPHAAQGVFLPYRAGAKAITYDPAVVPSGATATVRVTAKGKGVTVRLTTTGMIPRRSYGAHLHSEPCAGSPADSGPHYQHLPDPKAIASPPSVDPKFANPRNEVWLDFTADAAGSATASTTQTWPFDSINPPRSLVVHAEQTRTAAGRAGSAGPRAACLTLPL